jgi:hypothetical protein
MRLVWLALVLVGCTKHAADGEKVVVGDGDTVVVGTVRVDVESRDDGQVIVIHEGQRRDTRHVTGHREVKFGDHRVRFDEKGSSVAVVVRAYKLPSPLTSDDALLVADEAMSPASLGAVDCTSATLSTDGKTFVVRCHDTDRSDSNQTFKVDAATGSILSL